MKLPLYNSNRTMQLLNKTCLKKVPNLYTQENKGEDAIVHLKFFIDGFTWYLTELDQTTGQAFGYVYNAAYGGELGYFDLTELAQLKGSVGHGVERDRYWKPTTLAEVRKLH